MDYLFGLVIFLVLYPGLYSKPYVDRSKTELLSVAINESGLRPDHIPTAKHLLRAKGNQTCHQLLKDCTEYLDLVPSSSSQFIKPALALGLLQVGCLAETDHFYLTLLRDEDTRHMFTLLTEQFKSSRQQRRGHEKALELHLLRYNLDALLPVPRPIHQHCSGFHQERKNVVLNGIELGLHSSLNEATKHCDRVTGCAGIYLDGMGGFHSVAKYGGYVMPQNGTSLWLHRCTNRRKRSTGPECHSDRELRIHKVMQWVPVASGWYNAGSAIYYAIRGCEDEAENRGVEAALDLGSDALLMATGGASRAVQVGIGLAVKPAIKASVKKAIDYFKEE